MVRRSSAAVDEDGDPLPGTAPADVSHQSLVALVRSAVEPVLAQREVLPQRLPVESVGRVERLIELLGGGGIAGDHHAVQDQVPEPPPSSVTELVKQRSSQVGGVVCSRREDCGELPADDETAGEMLGGEMVLGEQRERLAAEELPGWPSCLGECPDPIAGGIPEPRLCQSHEWVELQPLGEGLERGRVGEESCQEHHQVPPLGGSQPGADQSVRRRIVAKQPHLGGNVLQRPPPPANVERELRAETAPQLDQVAPCGPGCRSLEIDQHVSNAQHGLPPGGTSHPDRDSPVIESSRRARRAVPRAP